MPEPLKNLYNQDLIRSLCDVLTTHATDFDAAGFTQAVFCPEWADMELKQRMAHISRSLREFLPGSFAEATDVLAKTAPSFSGFEYMFFPGFVELYGLDDYDTSIPALEAMTPYSSSEFAVRPFIKKYGEKMIAQMSTWSRSENFHVRRLASEGCRPRLPWAMALPELKKDPTPILPILERLRDDPSDFVRRSVANNLNDIAKDHPERIVDIAKAWLGLSRETDWVVRHGCRTLLKAGRPEALVLFGFREPEGIDVSELSHPESAQMGGSFTFSFELRSVEGPLGRLRLEYAVDFMKSNGKTSRKVFKIGEGDYDVPSRLVEKTHSFKEISTRRHYPGTHGLAILINGREKASGSFVLEHH